MIKERYVSLEIARLLKEKGFVTPCDWLYCSDGTFGHRNSLLDKEMFPAPTNQMAMKWLRDERGVYIQIKRSFNTFLYGVLILKVKDGTELHSIIPSKHETYEDAVEAALKYSLEKLI